MNILLNGATGRMGKEVIKKVAEEKDLNIVLNIIFLFFYFNNN